MAIEKLVKNKGKVKVVQSLQVTFYCIFINKLLGMVFCLDQKNEKWGIFLIFPEFFVNFTLKLLFLLIFHSFWYI